MKEGRREWRDGEAVSMRKHVLGGTEKGEERD